MPEKKTIKIDILDMEMSKGLPHWLDPIEKYKGKHDADRKKKHEAHIAAIKAQGDKKKREKLWQRTKARALKLLEKDKDDYIQDPKTGRLAGRKPGGGGHGGAVAGYKPGIKTETYTNDDEAFAGAKAVKDGWVEVSPVKSIEDAEAMGKIAQKPLGDAGREIAAKFGLKFKDPGPKIPAPGHERYQEAIDRVHQKAKERGGNYGAVSDLARATFLVNEPDDTDKIIAELAKKFEVSVEPWKITDVLYGDRAINLRLPNGVIAEVQMMHPAIAKAKNDDGGHDLYKVIRDSAPKGPNPDPVKLKTAKQKALDLYGAALMTMPSTWRDLLSTPNVKGLFKRLFGKRW